MMNNQYIRLFIHIVDIDKTYECYFTKNSSFDNNLVILFQLIKNELVGLDLSHLDTVLSEDYCISLDKTVSLTSLNIKDGMLFHIC